MDFQNITIICTEIFYRNYIENSTEKLDFWLDRNIDELWKYPKLREIFGGKDKTKTRSVDQLMDEKCDGSHCHKTL